jgi:hypothetical protein
MARENPKRSVSRSIANGGTRPEPEHNLCHQARARGDRCKVKEQKAKYSRREVI